MLISRNLPVFTFIDAGGRETVVPLSGSGRRVNAIGAHLASRIGEKGRIVGLVGRTGPDLVHAWLGCLVAGLRPLIIQYPTKKQSREYWQSSVRATIALTDLAAIISDDEVASSCPIEAGKSGPVLVTQADLAAAVDAAPDAAPDFQITDYAIVQLSSGTTGHRKAIEFRGNDLDRHVRDYNAALKLGPGDTIVSWLPLFHDMGYVACFVMPMILGIPVVMMDPMTWVARPAMLYEAIARHRGTLCYMPNFGFEVMSRQPAGDLSSMKRWISCSEPVSARTCARFAESAGVAPDTISPCYAMAENIFAVTLGRGFRTAMVEGAEAVSNGHPIPGVEVEVRKDGQIWVKSPTSLTAYIGADPILDARGFYPTGDLGALIDGELFVAGRKQDLVIQAGRKFMLSDVDLVLNRLYPEVKGRGVACAQQDDRLGTQAVLVLIESSDFFLRKDADAIAAALRDATGIEQLSVAFVPPRFLTKTSSGKFNRKKSSADYGLVLAARASERGAADPLSDLKDSFRLADWTRPVGKGLDSLSLTVLRVILDEAGVTYDPARTLSDYAGLLETPRPAAAAERQSIHIVSLADRGTLRALKTDNIAYLSRKLGCDVTLEHICMPPSPVLLSDLIFHDWFQPRVDGPDYAMVSRSMAALKRASLILVDDVAEMFFPPNQTYGALSHGFERDPNTDLVAVRWQRYPQLHDRLPLTLVAGADLALSDRSAVLDRLSAYLGVPVFRFSTVQGFAEFTADWEYRDYLRGPGGAAGNKKALRLPFFINALADFIAARPDPLRRVPRPQSDAIVGNDLAHYCSHFANKAALDRLIDHYDRVIIAGQTSSVPYLWQRAQTLGKDFCHVPSYAPEIVDKIDGDWQAILSCGPQGNYAVTRPFYAVMKSGLAGEYANVEPGPLTAERFAIVPTEVPPTGSDWYYPFPLARSGDRGKLQQIRKAARSQAERLREKRRALRERRATAQG